MAALSFWHANLRKFFDTWTSTGPKAALRDVKDTLLLPVHRRINRNFDRKHNVNTSGSIPLASLTIVGKGLDLIQNDDKYEPTSVVTFKRMMSILPKDLSDFVFVDFGSGKGRVLLMASEYEFKRIIGIEFSKELHRIAQENVVSYVNKKQRCRSIDLILDDAANFVIPEAKCVFFFYNPFSDADDVMVRVLNNISDSFAVNPRKMYFLYINPVLSHLFERFSFIRPVESRRFALFKGIIYESVP